jgi:hypothetical protein
MITTAWVRFTGAASLVLFGFAMGMVVKPTAEVRAQSPRIFELRTYTAPEGRLGDLHARFRNHTLRIFQKHGMTNVAFFSPLDAPLSQNTLVYLLAHSSREAAKKSWDAFRNDPEWKKVAAETQANGPIVAKVESLFLEATNYSPMK